jgi:hypothetical protein
MSYMSKPSLFGLDFSNRDFSIKDSWGKNQFNSAFPTALCCYLNSCNIPLNYINIQNSLLAIQELYVNDLFGNFSKDVLEYYFAFEAQYLPYQPYIINKLPRVDLVIQNRITHTSLQPLEIKLTALPDNTTCNESEDLFGCEMVIRPDSIVYLACSIIESLEVIPFDDLEIEWNDSLEVLNNYHLIYQNLLLILPKLENKERAFLLQPIWKTKGKSAELDDHCLDVFVWSNTAFLYFILDSLKFTINTGKISRQFRSLCWLYKMLIDYKQFGKFNAEQIINDLTYHTKNDKAFAVSGKVTQPYMKCTRLISPIVKKNEIKHIILGGGQNLLSPERRFDAIIFNSPEIFI